ncbi:unnamed protein product, partial [Ilex paraguariensis]
MRDSLVRSKIMGMESTELGDSMGAIDLNDGWRESIVNELLMDMGQGSIGRGPGIVIPDESNLVEVGLVSLISDQAHKELSLNTNGLVLQSKKYELGGGFILLDKSILK